MDNNFQLKDKYDPRFRYLHRERYLPTAFDESLSIVEKVNRLINYLHQVDELTNEMLGKWNEVYSWVMNEGLDTSITDRLNEWLENGVFKDLINTEIFSELNNKIDETLIKFEELKSEFEGEFTTLINQFYSEVNNMGTTKFNWSDE